MIDTNNGEELITVVTALNEGNDFVRIAKKVVADERITNDEALLLFEDASLGLVATLANYIREKKHGDKTYFNRNFVPIPGYMHIVMKAGN